MSWADADEPIATTATTAKILLSMPLPSGERSTATDDALPASLCAVDPARAGFKGRGVDRQPL
jgi:hypothetical protein